MNKDKLIELQKIVNEGAPSGEVLAIWTDGSNTVHVVTPEINLLTFNFIVKKVGELFNMDSEKQGGLNLPLKYKNNLNISGVGSYYVEKSSTEGSKRSS